ncbi:MAG: Rieske 2Fe-2S domain-containing protein [Pseudomonadota bacterium]
MLSAEDNKLLTEAGSGTPMGELLRRFWMPALLSEELPEPDCTPVKITMMGEPLLAFRDSEGRIGIIDQHCPHRGANLWLGRNEECGIRCVYHGWKFDVDGNCVDMPTSYPDLNAKDQIKIKSYPAREWGDIVWAYMGPKTDELPELPDLEFALLPPSHRYVSKKWQDCNWVQALEGSIDTAHFTFAHLTFEKSESEALDIARHLVKPVARLDMNHVRWIAEDPRPIIKVEEHDAGLVVGGGRRTDNDDIYWRIAQYLMPVHTFAPNAMPGENISGQSFVPFADTNCWIFTYVWNPDRPLTAAEREGFRNGNGVIAEVDENYVPLRSKANNYMIDRQLQKTSNYTGIRGISEQDAAVQDSQGEIVDRTKEHLGPTDLGIMRFRKCIMEAAKSLQDGQEPSAVLAADKYAVRSGAIIINNTSLSDVMTERFGSPSGFVGRTNPTPTAAE